MHLCFRICKSLIFLTPGLIFCPWCNSRQQLVFGQFKLWSWHWSISYKMCIVWLQIHWTKFFFLYLDASAFMCCPTLNIVHLENFFASFGKNILFGFGNNTHNRSLFYCKKKKYHCYKKYLWTTVPSSPSLAMADTVKPLLKSSFSCSGSKLNFGAPRPSCILYPAATNKKNNLLMYMYTCTTTTRKQ